MSDNNEFKKQPLPDNTNAPNSSEGSSSTTEPSAPNAPQEQINTIETVATTSPPRPPPPAAGFVCPPPNTSQSAYPTQQQFSYDVPPPSYQTAMSYPAAPTYGGTAAAEPTAYNGQAPKYYQAPPQPVITQTRLPQPVGQSAAVHTVRVPAGGVVVVQSGPNCRYCHMGVVARHNDTCCLLCLIILTIFTFPFGLVFLCCIPCTVQNRCTNCRRLS